MFNLFARDFRRRFDAYFVKIADGDYDRVYGMKAMVPHLNKELTILK